MTTDILNFNGTGFKLTNPVISRSTTANVDAIIKSQLDELNGLLLKKIFSFDSHAKRPATKTVLPVTEENYSPATLLKRDLAPQHVNGTWADQSLLEEIKEITNGTHSIGDIIFSDVNLSPLKEDYLNKLKSNWFNLDFNAKTILGYEGVTDYLIAYAYFVRKIVDVNGMINFINQTDLGIKNIYNYAVISATAKILDREKLKVDIFKSEHTKDLAEKIKNSGISFQASLFQSQILKTVEAHLNNEQYIDWINQWDKDHSSISLPEDVKLSLVKLIKNYNRNNTVKINRGNIGIFLPSMLSQQLGNPALNDDFSEENETDSSDQDFKVSFVENDQADLEISTSNVKCAAQLFYSMTLGDEMNVFNIVNYFTHKYMVRGAIEIRDAKLREDLQMYVFSNKFTDIETGRIMDRTRPAERQMFYRQVFNYGNAEITDDIIVNEEFSRLWKIAVLNCAKYLENSQESTSNNFVSKQNVMQSVEDLQYNLSTHCTGMVNVISPIIYKELNFVVRKIFMNKEVMRQVVPAGGSWWRVVEALFSGMQSKRMKTNAFVNKAIYGYQILKSVAEYNPSTFENDSNFSAFISNVDAFITTQSILQESLMSDVKKTDHDAGSDHLNGSADSNTPAKTTPAKDDWDF